MRLILSSLTKPRTSLIHNVCEGLLEISSWAVLRTCRDGYQKEGEGFIGWNGATFGNNCIAFDQSVQGSLDIVSRIPSQWKCEAERSSNLELRQVQETFSFQTFSKMDSRATCETSESRSLASTAKSSNETVTCMFLEKTSGLWLMNTSLLPVFKSFWYAVQA